MSYRAVDHHVADCVRHFLRRRHKVSSRGATRFSDDVVFGELGVLQLRRVRLGPRSWVSSEASRKAGCVMWSPELCGAQPASHGDNRFTGRLNAT